MATLTKKEYNLQIRPGGARLVVHVSQYDVREITPYPLRFYLIDGDSSFIGDSTITAKISGTKPDKKGFEYSAVFNYSGNGSYVEVALRDQMTVVPGPVECEIRLFQAGTNASGQSVQDAIGTANFILMVERAGLSDDVDISETVLPEYINAAREAAEEAAESAEAAGQSEANAHDYSLLSKSYAVGDTGVRQGEDEDNSMYYSQIARRAMLPGTDVQFQINNQGHLILTKTVQGETPITADLGKVVGDGGQPIDYVFDTYAEMVEAIGNGDVIEGGVCYVREELVDGNTQPY